MRQQRKEKELELHKLLEGGDEKLMEEGVKVYVRVRPPNAHEVIEDEGLAVTTAAEEGGHQTVIIQNKDHCVRCHYDGVFDEHSCQSDVFEVIKPAISQV